MLFEPGYDLVVFFVLMLALLPVVIIFAVIGDPLGLGVFPTTQRSAHISWLIVFTPVLFDLLAVTVTRS